MIPLFTKENLHDLESLSLLRTLYAFDFDGTLAPITAHPGDAKLSSLTRNLVLQLSDLAPVAIISGRSVSDLRTRLNMDLPFVIGNHGIEGIDRRILSYAREATRRWSEKIERRDLFMPFKSGIDFEDKIYSLAIHYRRSTNKKRALEHIEGLVGKLQPSPRVIYGKAVVNLLPRGAAVVHKGTALQALLKKAKLTHALYIGDDDTDEDVFRLKQKSILTVRVGYKIKSNAQYYIKRQHDINRVLRHLILSLSR